MSRLREKCAAGLTGCAFIPNHMTKGAPDGDAASESEVVMAESYPVHVVPARPGAVSEGFYVARKKHWPAHASFIVVMVLTKEGMADGQPLEVYEPGRKKPTALAEWALRDRVLGLREATDSHRAAVAS